MRENDLVCFLEILKNQPEIGGDSGELRGHRAADRALGFL